MQGRSLCRGALGARSPHDLFGRRIKKSPAFPAAARALPYRSSPSGEGAKRTAPCRHLQRRKAKRRGGDCAFAPRSSLAAPRLRRFLELAGPHVRAFPSEGSSPLFFAGRRRSEANSSMPPTWTKLAPSPNLRDFKGHRPRRHPSGHSYPAPAYRGPLSMKNRRVRIRRPCQTEPFLH